MQELIGVDITPQPPDVQMNFHGAVTHRRVLGHPEVMAVNPAAGLPAGRAADIFTGVLDRHHQSVRVS